MGWTLVPNSWFSTEYKRHFSDLSTCRSIDNFNCKQPLQTPTHYLANSKNGFQLLSQIVMTYDCWTLPHKTTYNCLTWNYYSKYISLTNRPHINNNLTKLTGRLIITAHSWITSKPSCLLGIELDRIILQLKNLFKEQNIPYPLIYNWYDLLLLLNKLHITNMYELCLTTFDFTSLYTSISYHDTTWAIIMRCKLLLKFAKLL